MKKYIVLLVGAILFASCDNFAKDVSEISSEEKVEIVPMHSVEELIDVVLSFNNHDEIKEKLVSNDYVMAQGFPYQGYATNVGYRR